MHRGDTRKRDLEETCRGNAQRRRVGEDTEVTLVTHTHRRDVEKRNTEGTRRVDAEEIHREDEQRKHI